MLVVVLILGGLLRFVALGRWSLWTDELYNLGLMPVSALLAHGIPADQHPPLYYLLLEQALRVGRSEWLMRLPSAVAGVLTIPVMWRVGVALKRPRLGLLAAALLAFAPLHVWYSREARMYGLAMFFWAASIYFYVQGWQRDNMLDTVGLVVTMTAGLYTAYPTLALWFMQMALFYLFWRLSDRGGRLARLVRWVAAQVVTAGLFSLWWPFLRQQLERSLVFDWLGLFEVVLGRETAERLNQWLAQSGLTTTLAGTLQLALIAGLLFVLAAFLVSVFVVRRPSLMALIKRWGYPMAVLIGLLLALSIVVGAIPRGLSLRRQLLVFWLPFSFLAAWALVRLKARWVVVGALALSFCLSVSVAFGPAYEDWRGTVGVIAEQGQTGDLIVISPPWSTMAFDYYYAGDMLYEAAIIRQEQEDKAALADARRVWLVVNRHPALAEQTVETEMWYLANGRVVGSYAFSQYLTVYEIVFGER
ncbi:MAG: glycosyltransferase family 39 protein [Candidatus Promineifilaceae bacterium]